MRFWHPGRRFQCIAVDIMEVSSQSKTGFKKIIVIGDLFTRYVWAVPVRDETAETLAIVILEDWILRLGPPERMLMDRAKAFMSKVMK